MVVLLTCFLAQSAWGQAAGEVHRVGTIQHFAISESSGLAASRRYPRVIWTHNDGGYQFLFALSRTGAMLGAFQVTGGNLIDWEAVAADGSGHLYLADTGADGLPRSHVAVHQVPEPNPYDRFGNARITQTWYLRFPGRRQDCEAFFVHGEYGYLVPRGSGAGSVTMYRFPLASTAASIALQPVARIALNAPVTDASISADNRHLGLVTTEGVYLVSINGNPGMAGLAARQFIPFRNEFMEGGTFLGRGRGFLASAETRELWLFAHPAF